MAIKVVHVGSNDTVEIHWKSADGNTHIEHRRAPSSMKSASTDSPKFRITEKE